MSAEDATGVRTYLSTVQRRLRSSFDDLGRFPRPGAASSPEPEEPADDHSIDGFRRGLDRQDVPVETGLDLETYVCRALEANGGRLWQQDICERTGWSPTTVSRTLSELEDTGPIVRVQFGRQKLVCLPDSVPDVRPSG